MAKMFYTLEEAAQKLGKAVEEVEKLASSGQLQEFRDRDRLMFKIEQVDLLAEGAGSLDIADDLEPISLASSGSGTGIGLADSKEGTGVSIFDAEDTEVADPSAQTVMSETSGETAPDFSAVDPAASGSGLLDLTREGDDTSLGADLLQDVYGDAGDTGIGQEAAAGELFEATTAQTEADAAPAPSALMVPAEAVDSKWSAAVGAASFIMAIGILATIALVALVMIGQAKGVSADAATGGLLSQLPPNPMIIGGGLAGAIFVFFIIGLVIGGRKNA